MSKWTIAEGDAADSVLADGLKTLWDRDIHRSPFSGPGFLRQQAEVARQRAAKPILALLKNEQGELMACWPLLLTKAKVLSLLQQEESDFCGPLQLPEIRPEVLGSGLALAIASTEAREAYLSNVPPRGDAAEAIWDALEKVSWRSEAVRAWACPVFRADEPEGRRRLEEILGAKSIRYFEARMKKMGSFQFEALRGVEDLEKWVEEFCDDHEWRWNPTRTPSQYRNEVARTNLLHKMKAWATDGNLVRFSVRLAGRRIAYCIGLLSRDEVVYHHTSYCPAFAKLSASTVLIRNILGWMRSEGFGTLNLGVGEEDYKKRFSTDSEPLTRFYAFRSRASASALRGRADRCLRASRWLMAAHGAIVNDWLRTELPALLRALSFRLNTIRKVHLTSPPSVLCGRVMGRLRGEREIFYWASAGGSDFDNTLAISELPLRSVLEMLEGEVGLLPSERSRYFERRHLGEKPIGLLEAGRVLQVCWLRPAHETETPPGLAAACGALWCIYDCRTAARARGRGLYPAVLKWILSSLPSGDRALIYTHTWNRASQAGILKAGFERVALRLKGRKWFEIGPTRAQRPSEPKAHDV